jgi:hypothetical protein
VFRQAELLKKAVRRGERIAIRQWVVDLVIVVGLSKIPSLIHNMGVHFAF